MWIYENVNMFEGSGSIFQLFIVWIIENVNIFEISDIIITKSLFCEFQAKIKIRNIMNNWSLGKTCLDWMDSVRI